MKLTSATYYRWTSVIKFLRLVDAGDVLLDFTMSEGARGGLHDHGFRWRVRSNAVHRIHLHSETILLD